MREHVAEAIGTFALVLVGCGAIAIDTRTGELGHVGVALAFGLVVAAMVAALGHISGAHLNPAVSIALGAGGHVSWPRVATYALSQVMAAITAAALLRVTLGDAADSVLTRPRVPVWTAVLWEAVFTAILVLVILAVATDDRGLRHLAPVAIGGAVALGALVAGPLTGASLNPARSIGPALVSGDLAGLWIYIVGPVAGGLIAMVTYRVIR